MKKLHAVHVLRRVKVSKQEFNKLREQSKKADEFDAGFRAGLERAADMASYLGNQDAERCIRALIKG